MSGRARSELARVRDQAHHEAEVRANQLQELRRSLDTKEAALSGARAEASELSKALEAVKDEDHVLLAGRRASADGPQDSCATVAENEKNVQWFVGGCNATRNGGEKQKKHA